MYLTIKECNPLRWLDYAFSTSIIVVLNAALAGIYDLEMQILLGTMTAISMGLFW